MEVASGVGFGVEEREGITQVAPGPCDETPVPFYLPFSCRD